MFAFHDARFDEFPPSLVPLLPPPLPPHPIHISKAKNKKKSDSPPQRDAASEMSMAERGQDVQASQLKGEQWGTSSSRVENEVQQLK